MDAKTRSHILTFLLVFATLGTAFGLDRLVNFLREQLSMTFEPLYLMSGMVVWSLGYIVIGFCVFFLYTNVFPLVEPVAIRIIAVIGLLTSFTPVLYWLSPFGYNLSIFVSGRYYFIGSGGLMAVAALFALYKMKKATA